MSQRPQQPIREDGTDFAKYNNPLGKEREPDTRFKANNQKNFDYKAIKRINK